MANSNKKLTEWIKASMGYTGLTKKELAKLLSLKTTDTLNRKLANPDEFTRYQLRIMKELFRWPSYDEDKLPELHTRRRA